MQKHSTAWLLWAVFACAACEGEPAGTPVDPFAGRWSCGETRNLTFTTPAGAPTATAQSRFIVNSSVAEGLLSLFASNDAGATCRLDFKAMGTSAVLMDGQTCATTDGITLTYKMGTAEVGETGLKTNLAFDFAGALQDADGGAPLDSSGSGTASSLCSKIYGFMGGGPTGGGGW